MQPHIFEPDEIVLAEWEIAHTEFRKELLASSLGTMRKKCGQRETIRTLSAAKCYVT